MEKTYIIKLSDIYGECDDEIWFIKTSRTLKDVEKIIDDACDYWSDNADEKGLPSKIEYLQDVLKEKHIEFEELVCDAIIDF